MPALRSRVTTHGRNAAGARALWRATGWATTTSAARSSRSPTPTPSSCPGTCTSRTWATFVAEAIREAGGVPREFNTIAVDDGIAMGHGGMLYSLPSREVIADSVEYMVNGHAADALVCISNCDKITPGCSTPRCGSTSRPSSSPAARWRPARPSSSTASRTPRRPHHRDLGLGVARRWTTRGSRLVERRLPDLRVVLGHVHRELDELPHRGPRAGPAGQRVDAGHARRAPRAVPRAGRTVMDLCRAGTTATTTRPCPATSPRARRSRTRWRSTSRWAGRRTRCCTSSPRRRKARSTSTLAAINAVSRRVPCLSKVAPTRTSTWKTCTGRVASRRSSVSCGAVAC